MTKVLIYLLIGIVWGSSLFLACDSAPADQIILQQDEELDVEVETTFDVELIYSDSAIVNVILTSPKMLTNRTRGDNQQVFPVGIDVDFFDPKGRVQSELTCKKATRYEKDKKIVMQDEVVWKSKAGEVLDTEELVWDEKEEKVYTKRLVKITTQQDVIHGYGFEADQGFTKWKIISPQGEMGVEN